MSSPDAYNTPATKQIDRLWPVKRVILVPRYVITAEQAGSASTLADPYYLFELGRPLTLQHPVTKMPHRPIRNTMKLTTLNKLEDVQEFSGVEQVYKGALV